MATGRAQPPPHAFPAPTESAEQRAATVRDTTFSVLRELGLTTIFSNPGSTEVPFLAGLIYAREAGGRLHHVAFWVDTREECLRAADLFLDAGVHIEAAPSKHAVAGGFFLYGFEPGGNRIEVTTGGHLMYDPEQEPLLWTEAERSRGQAWGVRTVESFHYYGTPPAGEEDRAYARAAGVATPAS